MEDRESTHSGLRVASTPRGIIPWQRLVYGIRACVGTHAGADELERAFLSNDRVRRWMRWAMSAFYFVAGVLHLRHPGAFLPIVPDWVPAPREVILFTGACEIAGAVALMTRSLRWWAGVMLALYAAAVFPANIKHAVYDVQLPGLPTSWWYHAPRLALQPVIMWWALYSVQVVTWPFGRRLARSRDAGNEETG